MLTLKKAELSLPLVIPNARKDPLGQATQDYIVPFTEGSRSIVKQLVCFVPAVDRLVVLLEL